MIGNNTKNAMAKLGVIAILIVLAATSCNKEQYWYGRKITFVAKSKGYMTKSAVTKTSYAGEDETVDTKLKERIDWSQGDLIYIYCGSATNQGDGTHYAEYGVEKFSAESDAVSKATIQPTDFANSMEWGTGTHDFYAMYPSPKGHATNSFTAGAMVFNMPAAYPVAPKTAQVTKDAVNGIINFKPDMDYAPMLAAQTGVSAGAGSVTLPFTPQFDAFEITIGKATYSTINLSQFRIYGAAGDKLSGTFTVAPTNYAAVQSIAEGATNTVTLDLNGADADTSDDIILDADYPTLKLTVLTLPGTFTNGITIEFTGEFDGAAQTRKLTLKTNTGDFVEFAPYKKYRIYGLTFPVLVGATIEDGISWDFGLEIMDSVIWWVGTGIENHITWTDDIDLNAYTELPDDVKWFEGSYIVNDFRWEELDHIALDDDSDAYLWRNQSLTRTVQAYNREGSGFSDVEATWSVAQEGRVIHLNQTTGEVTALGPGEATVTATVTPNDGSTPWTISYKVYVNAPTGITLTAANSSVVPEGTVGLTATVSFTSNGTITEYPADLLEWSSANTGVITVVGTQPTIGTGVATATATGVAEGTSTLTVSVASKYADGVSASLENFKCSTTDLTFPDPTKGEPYKFRGYYMHPGVLFWNGSSFSITDGSDPLELLQHYYYDSQTTKFDGTSGTALVNACYFTWTELEDRLGTDGSGNISGTFSADQPGTSTSYSWRIPTLGSSTGELYTIFNSNPTYGIKVNNLNSGNAYTDDTANLIFVNVNLSDAPAAYKTTGLGYHGDYNTYNTAGSKSYQAGILLVPDGAYLTCPRIKEVRGDFKDITATCNVISYGDLEILTSKGCVFVPSAGYYDTTWHNGGFVGYYWSNSPSSDKAFYFYIYNNTVVSTDGAVRSDVHMPVKLIHD